LSRAFIFLHQTHVLRVKSFIGPKSFPSTWFICIVRPPPVFQHHSIDEYSTETGELQGRRREKGGERREERGERMDEGRVKGRREGRRVPSGEWRVKERRERSKERNREKHPFFCV
jgi:hypothetical protein